MCVSWLDMLCRYDTRLTARGQSEAARAAARVARLKQRPEVRWDWTGGFPV